MLALVIPPIMQVLIGSEQDSACPGKGAPENLPTNHFRQPPTRFRQLSFLKIKLSKGLFKADFPPLPWRPLTIAD